VHPAGVEPAPDRFESGLALPLCAWVLNVHNPARVLIHVEWIPPKLFTVLGLGSDKEGQQHSQESIHDPTFT
jgi:hypothetical protein